MKKSILIAGLCGMLTTMVSCDNYDDMIPEEYNKILSLKVYGEQNITLYKTGELTEYQITAMKSGNDPAALANATVTAMSDAQFAAYLDETGLAYKKLPAECYSFVDNELDFASDQTWKITKLNIDPAKVDKYLTSSSDTYVIPVVMVSQNDSILEGLDHIILKPTVVTPSISFMGDASVYMQEMSSAGGTISVPLGMQVDNQWDFDVQVELDPEKTTIKGVELQDGGKVHFSKGNKPSAMVKLDGLTQASGEIGLRIKNVQGMDGFNFDSNTVVVTVLAAKYPLTVSMLSSNAVEPSEGSLANLLDGDVSSFFHSCWSVSVASDHYVQVDLPETIKSFVFEYTNRQQNGNAALANFDVLAGPDEDSLELLKNYTEDADYLPTGGAGVFVSKSLTPPAGTKVIRFVCHKNHTNGKFFVWSEFGLRALK